MEGEEVVKGRGRLFLSVCDELAMIRSTRDMKIPPRKPTRDSATTMIPDTRRMTAVETWLFPMTVLSWSLLVTRHTPMANSRIPQS